MRQDAARVRQEEKRIKFDRPRIRLDQRRTRRDQSSMRRDDEMLCVCLFRGPDNDEPITINPRPCRAHLISVRLKKQTADSKL